MYALVEYRELDEGIIKINNHIGILKEVRVDSRLSTENNKKYVEPNFRVCFNSQIPKLEVNIPSSMMIAYIGGNRNIFNDRSYYDLNNHQFIIKKQFASHINTFTAKEGITSIDYIICITDLIYRSLVEEKRLIIYSDIYIPEEEYRYRSLMNKTINSLLKDVNGILIQRTTENIGEYYKVSRNRFEFYIEDTLYTEDKFEMAVNKVVELINKGSKREELKREYRRL